MHSNRAFQRFMRVIDTIKPFRVPPQEFSSPDAFLDAISKSWHEQWQRVYSTDRADTVPFQDNGVDYQVVYTPSIKFWSVFTQGEHAARLC